VSTPAPEHTSRVSDLAGVLACVPSLLGFVPERSVVVLCLASSRVVLTMRVDLDGSNVSTLADTVVMAARRAGADELVAIGYVPKPSRVILAVLQDLSIAVETATAGPSPLCVRHLLAVGRDGWCELPHWGTELPPLRPHVEVDNHPVRAERVVAGRAVARSRKEVAMRVQPGSEQRSVEFELAVEATLLALPGLDDETAVALTGEHLDAIEDDPSAPVDDAVLGRMTALLAHPLARDEAMLRIDASTACGYVDVWSRVARLTGGRPALKALLLAGTAAWVSGDGATVNMCMEAGREIDPDHVGVQLLAAVTDGCLPPEVFEQIKADVRRGTQ